MKTMLSSSLLLLWLFASQLLAVSSGGPKKPILQHEDIVALYRFDALADELQKQYNSVDCNSALQCICSAMKQDATQSLCIQGPLLSQRTISSIEHTCDLSVQQSNAEEQQYLLSNRKLRLRKALLFDCYLSKRQEWSRQLHHQMPTANTMKTRDIVVDAIYQNRKKPPKLELQIKTAVSVWFDKYRSRTSWRVRLVNSGNRALLPQDITLPILASTKEVHELIQENLPTSPSPFSLYYHQGSTYVELPCDNDTTLLHCGLVPSNIKLVFKLKPSGTC